MIDDLLKKYKHAITNMGWSFTQNDKTIEIENWSPAGEDLAFNFAIENLPNEIREFADNFDPERHAYEMYGTNGAPTSLRDLLDDADKIDEMLSDLAEAIENVENATSIIEGYPFNEGSEDNRIEDITRKEDDKIVISMKENQEITINEAELHEITEFGFSETLAAMTEYIISNQELSHPQLEDIHACEFADTLLCDPEFEKLIGDFIEKKLLHK